MNTKRHEDADYCPLTKQATQPQHQKANTTPKATATTTAQQQQTTMMKTALHTSPSLSSFSDVSVELASTDVSETSSLVDEEEVYSDAELDESQRRPLVSFGPVHVREYERIVGDHPDTRVGVPLAIGWAFVQKPPQSIERFEADTIRKGNLRMTSLTRKNILHNVFGIPEEEIRQAEVENQKIKKQREQTSKQQAAKSGKKDTALKSISRKVRRGSWNLLKGMAAAGTMISGPGAISSAGHAF